MKRGILLLYLLMSGASLADEWISPLGNLVDGVTIYQAKLKSLPYGQVVCTTDRAEFLVHKVDDSWFLIEPMKSAGMLSITYVRADDPALQDRKVSRCTLEQLGNLMP